jgi:glycosyltransferase involved in cell wall biosynthesis
MQHLPPIVCISNAEWDAVIPTNRQQLMRRFAEHTRVLYVEAPLPVLGSFVGQSKRRQRRRGWRREGNVLILQAWDWVPYPVTQRSPILSRSIDSGLRRYIRGHWRSLGWPAPVAWIFAPDAGDLLGTFDERLSVYHCVDDFAAAEQFNHYRRVAAYDERKSEAYLARSVDVVVTTAQPLYDRWRVVNTNTYLLPNVADTALFRQALDPGPEHPLLAELPLPRIAFVGALDRYKVDFNLLASVAQRCPDLQFVCVGPAGAGDRTALSSLPKQPNLHYVGALPQAELPAVLRGCAACIIPYHLNEYTAAVSPLKLYEYLAAGRPVVATPIPSLRDVHARGLHLADPNPTAMVASLREALNADDETRAAIADAAQSHSWARRMEELAELLQIHLAHKASNEPV